MPDVVSAVLGQLGAAVFLLSAVWFGQPYLDRWLDRRDERKEDE